ncbi:hypothetical protein PWT90_07783 [Aphanocladium album]|nr:hypothetical protein PWT90_07783 [Aphanocladium album]
MDGQDNDRSDAAPKSIPARRHLQSDEMSESMARSFDSFSRSVPLTMPFLEAEPQPILLPHDPDAVADTASTTSRRGNTSANDEESTLNSRKCVTTGSGTPKGDEPSETSPLLRRDNDDDDDDDAASSSASSPATSEEAPLFLNGVSPARFWFVFVQVLASLFIGCFDSTIMASSHPVITSHFGAANAASWLSTTFLLTSTAFQPVLGRLSDSLGRKPLFIGGVGLLTAGTAWCGLAQSLGSFVAARALCGLGAGGTVALGSIMTSDLVPIERRGSFQSLINAVWGAGTAAGAASGGWLAETVGWRWEFGIQVPVLLLIFGASFVAIPDDIGIRGKPPRTVLQALQEFDLRGSALLTTSTTTFILGLNLGGNILPWSHPIVIASMSTFAVAFPTFLWTQARTAKPIMPLHLISKMPHVNLIFGNFIASLLANAVLFNMPLYFQAVLLTSATTSGLRLVLPSIVGSVAGVSTGFLITYTRRLKWPLTLGTALGIAGNVSLLLLRRGLPAPVYVLALFPSSFGNGFQFPGAFMAVLASSPQSEQAVVTSTLLLWRSLGGVLGVATSSLVVQNALLHYLQRMVRGDLRDEVIESVRRSVEIVAQLDEPYREQVIQSYEATLRLTFLFTTTMAVVAFFLMMPMKLIRLPERK